MKKCKFIDDMVTKNLTDKQIIKKVLKYIYE